MKFAITLNFDVEPAGPLPRMTLPEIVYAVGRELESEAVLFGYLDGQRVYTVNKVEVAE
jgi:hypothetical protein